MKVLDLFSGIGGFSLGLERTGGFQTVAFCEVNEFCRRVLATHWPEVPCYEDVRELDHQRLAADGIFPDILVGGFPCQDISTAGKGAGIEGERSGLWREYARLIGELRPRWVIIENVPALRTRGADRVLGDLEAAGYAATPLVVGAVHAGAPHKRQRVWIVAHAIGDAGIACRAGDASKGAKGRDAGRGSVGAHVANAARVLAGRPEQRAERQRVGAGGEQGDLGHAEHGGREGRDQALTGEPGATMPSGWWLAEPDVGRVAHGVPQRVDRLRALGNAVVPQVVEAIGRAILAADAGQQQRAD